MIQTNQICDYGCGQPAKYQFKNGKCCCNQYVFGCPNRKTTGTRAWNKGLSKNTDKRVAKNAKNMKETKQQMTFIAWNKGLTKYDDKRVAKYTETMKITKKGRPNYKNRKPISVNGITPGKLRHLFKKSLYTEWTYPILKRDGFLCKKCGNSINLEVHHIKPYREIFNEAMKVIGLNIESYLKWSKENIKELEKQINKLHTLNLGITLCKQCHGEEDENRKRFLQKK